MRADKATITRAANGYILKHGDHISVIENDDPVGATFDLLWEVLEEMGHTGTKWDERRVGVVIEPGDHWERPADQTGEGVTSADQPAP